MSSVQHNSAHKCFLVKYMKTFPYKRFYKRKDASYRVYRVSGGLGRDGVCIAVERQEPETTR